MNLQSFGPTLHKCAHKGLLLDTNLLLLFLAGNLGSVKKSKVTANQGFDQGDFELLLTIMKHFRRFPTTPHILTEVSNHADKLKQEHQEKLRVLVNMFDRLNEHYEPAANLIKTDAFARFGLTDAAIAHVGANGFMVLSVDFELIGYLQKRGLPAFNFNHLRQLNWSA